MGRVGTIFMAACLRMAAAAACALLAAAAHAEVPLLPLSGVQAVPLSRAADCRLVPSAAALDAEAAWSTRQGSACDPSQARDGAATILRARLAPPDDSAGFSLQVMSTRIDEVTVHTRLPGRAWSTARAGDRIALAEWPVFGQTPTFLLPPATGPIDVVLVLHDSANAQAEVLAWPLAAHARARILQSNLSGIVTGLGLMTVVTCLITALTLRSRSAWLGLAFAGWSVLTVVALNGFGAIWLYPGSAWLNDRLKGIAPIVLAALLFWWVLRQADRLPPGRWRNRSVLAAVLLALAAIAVMLPDATADWRRPVVVAYVLLATLACATLCVASRLNGGHYVTWLALALVFFVASVATGLSSGWLVDGVDLRSAVGGCLLYGTALTLRHTHFLRMRFGRNLLGIEARSATHDRLTALLSYRGLSHAYDALRLHLGSGGDQRICAILLLLGSADRTGESLGFEIDDDVQIRLAATMRAALGEPWQVARLSKGHFAALAAFPGTAQGGVPECASLLLAGCSRMTHPVDVVGVLDTRIAWVAGIDPQRDLGDVLKVLDEAARQLPQGKRIAAAA
jgi:GGDEF domain-containing protein